MTDFSILISTWNNCQRLELTLNALARMTIPSPLTWELLLVNNNCSDQTDEVVRKFMNRLPLVYVKEPLQGLSRARNTGLSAATGRLVVFTDDDVEPFPEWIPAYWSAYQEHPEGYFWGGPIVSEFENPEFDRELLALAPSSVRGLDWGQDERVLGKDEYFIAANWACPRDILFDSGGFNVTKGLGSRGNKVSIGEENDLMNRLEQKGWKPLYVPQAKIYHFVSREKCTLKHIADRCEAAGFEHAPQFLDAAKHRLFAGVPLWMYKRYLLLWKNWISAKIRGEKGLPQYLEYRRMIGIMRGARSLFNRKAV